MRDIGPTYGDAVPEATARTHVHTRAVEFRGYYREDGLWDIEADLADTKTYPHERPAGALLQPGAAVHRMAIRLTVNDELEITGVATTMPATPFVECQQAKLPVRRLIGYRLGRGWRKAIEEALGGTQGCAHIRELLFNMATVAYQTIPLYRKHLRRLAGTPEPRLDQPLPHFGKCIAWDFKGAVMKRLWPQFAESDPKEG